MIVASVRDHMAPGAEEASLTPTGSGWKSPRAASWQQNELHMALKGQHS